MNFENFKKDLAIYQPEKIIFVGLGNESRGDDYAGILFLEELKKRSEFINSKFLSVGTNPENYLFQLTKNEIDVIVFIDAVQTNSSPGKIMWLAPDQIEMIAISTHSFSIKMVEQYINSIRPAEFKYLGITAVSYEYGKPVSQMILNSITDFFNEWKLLEKR